MAGAHGSGGRGVSGEAGGGYFYPDSEDETGHAEPVLRRHADHDPALICRPALGYGLCEVLGDEERGDKEEL